MSAMFRNIATGLSAAAAFGALLFAGLLFPAPKCAGQDTVEGQFGVLDRKLEEYADAMKSATLQVQCAETDFLIESSSDSLIRQHIALKLYDIYVNSKIMGAETVAVHIFDKWFASGKIAMKSETDKINAGIFSELNRKTLIGKNAPPVKACNMDGDSTVIFAEPPGKYTILYFYDTGCAKCRLESLMLGSIIDNARVEADLYAIDLGSSPQTWKEYAEKYFEGHSGNINVINLTIHDRGSDCIFDYGILQTPKMLLVDPAGTVIGRNLDSSALEIMLDGLAGSGEIDYGSEESAGFYKKVLGANPECSEIAGTYRHIRERTLGGRDTLLYRQMTGDLLYFLTSGRSEEMKCGCDFVARAILSDEHIWTGEDDSLKVVNLASFFHSLYSRSPEGEKISPVKVSAVLVRGGRQKAGTYTLDRLSGKRNIIIFHTEGCGICKKEIETALDIAADDRKTRVLLVDMDEIISSDPRTADILFTEFDLAALPYVTETDRKGIVMRKYVTLAD